MKNLKLSDEEAAVLTRALTDITRDDSCPLSPRVQTLKAILGKLERVKAPARWIWRRDTRGTPYHNEQVKLSATFFNSLAVVSFTSAFVLPFFTTGLRLVACAAALFITILLRYLAHSALRDME